MQASARRWRLDSTMMVRLLTIQPYKQAEAGLTQFALQAGMLFLRAGRWSAAGKLRW